MAWTLLFLALLSYCSGGNSQPTISQPRSQSVSVGETVSLSCLESSDGKWGSTHWYQQKPQQAPRLVWYGSSTRGEGFPDRFTGSSSGNNGLLNISNIQDEDEGIYYCGSLESTKGNNWIFGSGTKLSIERGNSQPTVSQPRSQSASVGETVSISCLKSSDGKWGSTHWYQEKPQQAPRLVWYGSSTRGEGFPDRFTGSSSGNTGLLNISNVQDEDEADYYCVSSESTKGNNWIFGSGTKLSIKQ